MSLMKVFQGLVVLLQVFDTTQVVNCFKVESDAAVDADPCRPC